MSEPPTLLLGDCFEVLQTLEADSVDACVCDPPYGLNFMGRHWDRGVPAADVWEQVYRVLKPGAHLLSFFGTRTYHRGVTAIELAGFDIRDQILWIFGSGFPKSLNVEKAIGDDPRAAEWAGFGTALKPATEPIVVARKPPIGTVAQNVLEHGTGGLNIDGCRVGTEERPNIQPDRGRITGNSWEGGLDGSLCGSRAEGSTTQGRWPANIIHDGSDEVLAEFAKYGERSSGSRPPEYGIAAGQGRYNEFGSGPMPEITGSTGTAARFFYTAKASKDDRNDGLHDWEHEQVINTDTPPGTPGSNSPRAGAGRLGAQKNHHPTVKPTSLMRYLVRLVTPKGGLVLDPFAGSGTTLIAAYREDCRAVGIELDPDYFKMASHRIDKATAQLRLEL